MKKWFEEDGVLEYALTLAQNPAKSYSEIANTLKKVFGVTVTKDAVQKKLKRIGITRKFETLNSIIKSKKLSQQTVIIDTNNFKEDYINLRIISDTHTGDPFSNEYLFQKTIDWVKANKNAFVYLSGDLLNFVTTTSVGNVYQQIIPPEQQKEDIITRLLPIRERILGVITGNHEVRISKIAGLNPMFDIANILKIPYYEDVILHILKFDSSDTYYSLYLKHGRTASATPGGIINALFRMENAFDVDLYIMSHAHHQMISGKEKYKEVNGTLLSTKKLFIVAGSFLEYGGYSVERDFHPSLLGTPLITCSIKHKKINATISAEW